MSAPSTEGYWTIAAAHRIVVETPPTAAADALAELTARLGTCTVERARDGSARIQLDYREPSTEPGSRISLLSRSLTTVERWLRQQPVPAVTIWVDGRRFALTRRDATARPPTAGSARARARADQSAARTASS